MRSKFLALGLAVLSLLVYPTTALPINSPMLAVYDYIVVGGGASGLTVANRLTEDPRINVLVLEAGPADNYEAFILIPVRVGSDIISQYNWNLTTVPQEYLDGRVRTIPQGRGLGGGTLINAMLWNRGGQGDYNDWATLGNPGWDWDSMLPYFMRSETFTNDVDDSDANQYSIHPITSVHGTSGPVNVSYSKYFYASSQLFFEGLTELGVPIAEDPNEGSVAGGYFLPMDMDPNNMTRSDARLSYYEPFSYRPNFNVQVGQQVTRLLFENSTCGNASEGLRIIGVEYASSSTSPRQQVYASREVILAAGSLHTPQIMELSGIGQPSVLSQYGIETILNLPGVGNNLQDHYMTGTNWPYENTSIIIPSWLGNNATFAAWAAEEYYDSRTGPWTAGPPNGVAFPSLPDISPENYTNIVAAAGAQTPGEYLADGLDPTIIAGYTAMHRLLVAALGDPTRAAYELLNANTGYFTQSIMRPFSRGTTHIASSDPFVSSAIDPRYASNPTDMAILVETYRFNFRLLESQAMAPLQANWWIPWPTSTDAYLESLIKNLTQTEYHVSGTCAMLPRELGGVVDSTALVYGTQNLRIVDASIQPMPPAAHLQAVVYGVAEKCADLIRAASAWTTSPTIVLPPSTATSCALSSSTSVSSSTSTVSTPSLSVIMPVFNSSSTTSIVSVTSPVSNLTSTPTIVTVSIISSTYFSTISTLVVNSSTSIITSSAPVLATTLLNSTSSSNLISSSSEILSTTSSIVVSNPSSIQPGVPIVNTTASMPISTLASGVSKTSSTVTLLPNSAVYVSNSTTPQSTGPIPTATSSNPTITTSFNFSSFSSGMMHSTSGVASSSPVFTQSPSIIYTTVLSSNPVTTVSAIPASMSTKTTSVSVSALSSSARTIYATVQETYYTTVYLATTTIIDSIGSTSISVYSTTSTFATIVTITGTASPSSAAIATISLAATSTSTSEEILYTTVKTTSYTTVCPATATFTNGAGSIITSVYTTTSTITAVVTVTHTISSGISPEAPSQEASSAPTPSVIVSSSSGKATATVFTTIETTTFLTVFPTTSTATNSLGSTTTSTYDQTSTYTSVITVAYITITSTVTIAPTTTRCKTTDISTAVVHTPHTVRVKTTYYETVCRGHRATSHPFGYTYSARSSSSSAPAASLGLEPASTITPVMTPTMGFPWAPPLHSGFSHASSVQWQSWSSKKW